MKRKFPPREGDLPREELIARANRAVASYPCRVDVHFKYTCPECGQRCMLQEPNMLYENGECHKCGTVSPIEAGGFTLRIAINEPKR